MEVLLTFLGSFILGSSVIYLTTYHTAAGCNCPRADSCFCPELTVYTLPLPEVADAEVLHLKPNDSTKKGTIKDIKKSEVYS